MDIPSLIFCSIVKFGDGFIVSDGVFLMSSLSPPPPVCATGVGVGGGGGIGAGFVPFNYVIKTLLQAIAGTEYTCADDELTKLPLEVLRLISFVQFTLA